MKYAVSPEGVSELNKMAQAVSGAVEQLESLTTKMAGVADEYSGTIGPHQQELSNALQDISSSVKKASEPATSASSILTSVAQKYEAIISKNRFKK